MTWFRVFAIAAVATLLLGAIARSRAGETPSEKGEALLRQVAARYDALESMTAEFTDEWRVADRVIRRRGAVTLRKPNLARWESSVPNGLTVWDGTHIWRLKRDENRYSKSYRDPRGNAEIIADDDPVTFFFSSRSLVHKPVAEYIGTEAIDGAPYQIVEASLRQGRVRLFIGSDMLVHRIDGRRSGSTFTRKLANIALNAPTQPADFTFVPPPGARKTENPEAARLAPVGCAIPDFTVTAFNGARVSLRDLRKQNRAVIVHFWSYP